MTIITFDHPDLDELDPIADFAADDATWQKQGRCVDGNGTLTSLFFSEDIHDIARAKAVCAKCSVSDLCLAAALERAEPWGVWGGQLLKNGRILTSKRGRGRPPKVPRPELVVDEVPIPPHLLKHTA